MLATVILGEPVIVTASSHVTSSSILCVPSPAVKSVVAVDPITNLASVIVADDTVVDTLRFKLRKNYKDKDYVQKLHNIKKSNLKELGFITDKNGKTILDPRIKKALDDFKKSRK